MVCERKGLSPRGWGLFLPVALQKEYYFRGVKRSLMCLMGLIILLSACEERACIDCQDGNGNVFTFCDPPEPVFDSLTCGTVYTARE